jgi:23S rRNA (uracil1939-C5)-methyltransferase
MTLTPATPPPHDRDTGARVRPRAVTIAAPTASPQARIDSLSAEGRGVARMVGKAVFIDGALPGERVTFRYLKRRGGHDEGVATALLVASPERVAPRCAHFGLCGGCSLQHLAPEAQLRHKEGVLMAQLAYIGGLRPARRLEPAAAEPWAYRRRARLSVRFVEKKGGVLVGFTERRGQRVAELRSCEVLHPSVGRDLLGLRALIGELAAARHIPQIEVAAGDSGTAVVIRHLKPLSESDRERLCGYAERERLAVFSQPGGAETVTPLWPLEEQALSYRLPGEVEIQFQPNDFIQVNGAINRALVATVVDLLAPDRHDRILDLYCGLGNFSLPLARRAGEVVGVEGDRRLVERARENARRNRIENAAFFSCDLSAPDAAGPVLRGAFEGVVIDPPRVGALGPIQAMDLSGVLRIVYVSCHPATLARDAKVLCARHGFRLEAAGVFDMFPHTSHIEALALFVRG